jgi:hypothetical protein
MNIITVNHTTHSGTEAIDVVMADEAIAELTAAIEEVDRLKAMIQELKCCGNCKNDKFAGEDNCSGCSYPELLNWELSK